MTEMCESRIFNVELNRIEFHLIQMRIDKILSKLKQIELNRIELLKHNFYLII